MLTEVRLLQYENDWFPIEVTELGIVTEVKSVQLRNALSMAVTVLGMVTAPPFPMYPIRVSLLVFEKTKSPSVIPFIKNAPHGAPVAVPWYSICRTWENAELPIEVTELGTMTEDSPLHPEKAELPIEVTELGMMTEDSPLHPENAELPIEVTELPMVTEARP